MSRASGRWGAEFQTTDYNFFGQFDWKFTPRMTINLGLRYEWQKLPDAQYANASTAGIPNTNVTFNQATSKLPNDKNNFGPRAGFAVDITGDGKTFDFAVATACTTVGRSTRRSTMPCSTLEIRLVIPG
jgi:outer membrane receptor protein involved in Fe transport